MLLRLQPAQSTNFLFMTSGTFGGLSL